MADRVRVGDPTWINNGDSAREARVATEGLLTAAKTYGRGGLMASGNPVGPTQTPSTRSLVTPCWVAVPQAGQGVWMVPVESTITLQHADPSSSGARVDLVVARVYDTEAGHVIPANVAPAPYLRDGVSVTQSGVGVIEVIEGIPGGQAPSLPPASLLIRAVVMPAGAGAVLTQNAYTAEGPIATARGGIAVVHSQSEQDQLDSYEGLTALRRDTGAIETRWKGKWRPTAQLNGRTVWTPTLRGKDGVQINYGQGGYATGRASVVGAEASINAHIQFGSTGINGQTGTLTFDLPTGAVSTGNFQSISCKLWCPEQQRSYLGCIEFQGGSTRGTIVMPSAYNDCSMRPARNTDPATPTQPGTGIPRIDAVAGGGTAAYTIQNGGSITAWGTMELAIA